MRLPPARPSAALAALFAVALAPLPAATYTIADGDVAALKAAIHAANASAEDDLIVLAPNGTYTLTSVDNTSAEFGPNGLPLLGTAWPANAAGKLTIEGQGATLQRSYAGGTPDFRLLQTVQDAHTEIRHLTLKNGRSSFSGGGAFFRERNTLTFIHCHFEDHRTTNNSDFGGGGAVHYKHLSSGTFTDCTFVNNRSDACGGALHVQLSNLTLTRTTFTGNTSYIQLPNSGGGGALFIDGAAGDSGTISITDSTFTSNAAVHQGGALFLQLYNQNTATLSRLLFTGNACTGTSTNDGLGGALFIVSEAISNASVNYLNPQDNGTVSLSASTFSGNSAKAQGGAIWKGGQCQLTLTNSTFTGNQAVNAADQGLGGALMLLGGHSLIEHCTLANNHAGFEAGALRSEYHFATVRNTILANNTANNPWGTKQDVANTSGPFGATTDPCFPGSHNIQWPAPSGGEYSPHVTSTPIKQDPLLAPLANQGGPVPTLAIAGPSPAVNSGSSTVTTDARGYTRDAQPDIGAYEYGASAPGFAGWVAAQGLTGSNALPLADPDNDGQPNLLEYALGLHPGLPDLKPGGTNTPGQPIASLHAQSGNFYLQLTYTRPHPAPTDITYTHRFAGSLAGLGGGSSLTPHSVTLNGNGTATVVVRDTLPTTPAAPRFARLEVLIP